MIPLAETGSSRFFGLGRGIQAGGPSSSHQFLGEYLEGKPPWVLLDLSDQVPLVVELGSPNGLLIGHLRGFPCLMQRDVTLRAAGFPSRRIACAAQARQGVVPPKHPVLCTSLPPARHRVIACCDRLLPRRAHRALHRLSGHNPTQLINEPGFFKEVSQFVANVFSSRTRQSLIFDARRGIAIVRSIIETPIPRLKVSSWPRFRTIRSFLETISFTKIPLLSNRVSPHSGDLLLNSPAMRTCPSAS